LVSHLFTDLKLVQLEGRDESDLDVLGIGVVGETSAAEVWSVLPSVSEVSPSPQILAILTVFLALSLQYPHTDMRSAAYNAYSTVVAKTVSLRVFLDSFQLNLHPF